MTVAALPATVEYHEDGVTTAFAVPYRFRAAADLIVERIASGTVQLLALGIDYTIVGGETDAGGTLTRLAATNGAVLRIRRSTARAQRMIYTAGDRFPAESHEEALDRGALIAQEQDAEIGDTRDRALLVPPGEATPDLPPAALRKGSVLGFHLEDGSLEMLPVGSFPAGPPGGSDNTYTSRSLLRASPVTRKTASLVGDNFAPDGRFNYQSGSGPHVDDEGLTTLVPPGDVVGAWRRQAADGLAYQAAPGAIAVSQAGFNGDYAAVHLFRLPGETNDLAAWNRARAVAKRIRLVAGKGAGPGGAYLLNFAPVTGEMEIFGDGAATVVRPTTLANGCCFLANSGAGTAFIDNISLHDFTLYGRVEEGGFSEPEHLCRFSGVRNLQIQRMRVLGFRGDGIYVGSGEVLGDQRFNIGVTIQDSYFDGINNDNRNAISVIDGRQVKITGNTFRRCTRPNMPGPIDFEPDGQPYHLQSDLTIDKNIFDACGGNLGQIGFLFPGSVALPSRISIRSNKFTNYAGTGADIAVDMRRVVSAADYSMCMVIDDNSGVSGNRPIDIISAIGVVVTSANQFQDYKGGSLIAFTGATDKVRDVEFAGRYTRVGSLSKAGLLVNAATSAIVSGIYDTCGKAGADGFGIQFGNTNSSTIALRNVTIIPNAGQTIAINSDGHSFAPSTNRQVNVSAGGLLNQFAYRSEMRATLVFSNGWSDAGSTIVERNAEGRVSINLNLNGGAVAAGTLIAMLPVGYRPSAQVFGTFQSGTAFGALRFDPDGSVFITPNAAPAPSMKGFISFTVGQ